ncbi:hypothetical protein GQX74_005806 [Glossina fuscipes]|nr:hypothetical protein GQX74_005806 [Glossina fuscipes]
MYLKTNFKTLKISITVLLLFALIRKPTDSWAQANIADVVILNDLLNWEHVNRTCLARDCDEHVNLKQLQQINTYMNDEADPCEDFHKYACEHWKIEHPNEMTMAAVAYKQITKKLLEIFEDNKSEFKAELQNNAIYRKLNDYYKVCKENEQQNSSILWLYLNELNEMGFLRPSENPSWLQTYKELQLLMDNPYFWRFSMENKIRTESDQLIKNVFEELKQTFAEIVEENQLKFADRNKKYLMSKLNGVSLNIGNLPANVSDDFYQNYLQDYQATNNFYLNHLLALKHYYTQQLSLGSSLNDNAPWFSFESLDPFVLDSISTATYFSVTNMITLPFTYLQVPFYSPQFWPPLLYGDLATTMGHELIHAFDPGSLVYDSGGKLAEMEFKLISKNWHYKNAIKCLNHKPTEFLDERVADVSGSRLALLTFKRKYFFSPSNAKMFFLQYAQFFCGNADNFGEFHAQDSTHDIDGVRLNYTLSHSSEFAEIFGCPTDSPMNPRTKCQLW